MTDGNFEGLIKRLAAEDAAAPIPDSAAIWWRARLRQRMADGYRVTRPLRVAERAACVLCFAAAVAAGARVGTAGLLPFIAVTLAAGAGAAAFVLRAE
jgi:hypothetical protein